MKAINPISSLSLSVIRAVAAQVNLDVIENDGLFTVYVGENFLTSCASEDVLLGIVNERIGLHNDRIAATEAEYARVAAKTEGFTLAAVLDQYGEVIGTVQADPKASHITLTDGVMGETTLNARDRKLSRSKVNLSKDVPHLLAHVLKDRVVYEFDEQ
ncbi:hypothetical protein [Pseudaeromonas pectinilytica]